jgi:ABC-type amino acid transport substrate-binding protein
LILAVIMLVVWSGAAWPAPLTIAAEDDAEPWSKRDGTGFANDVVRAAFKAVNVEAKLEVVPYARCKDMAIKGAVAACFSMAWLPEFEGRIVFAEQPIYAGYADYYTRVAKPVKATRESAMPKGTIVGVVTGYEYPLNAYKLKDNGRVAFEESESEILNLKKLARGRVDVALLVLNETKPAEVLMARAGVTGKLKRAFRCGNFASYIGFSKLHPEGMKALESYNKGFRIISGNGELKAIEKKWRNIALAEANKLSGRQQ